MRRALPLALWLAAAAAAQSPTTLDCGVPADGVITPGGPPVQFRFNAAEPNDAIAIRLIPTSDPKVSVTATVRDSGGRKILPRPASIFYQSGGEFDLGDAGDYTIDVQATSSTASGSFRIVRARLKGPCNGAALACGTPVQDQLVSAAVRTYQFSGETGDIFSIRLAKLAVTSTADERYATFVVAAYDAAGQLTQIVPKSPSDRPVAAAVSTAGSARMDVRLTSRGVQNIVVFENSTGLRAASYALAIARLNGPCRGKTAGCGTSTDSSIAAPLAIESYSLAASAGDVFLIRRASTGAGSLRPVVEVYNPDGSYVPPAAGSDAAYTFTAASSGGYTVLLNDSALATGAYAISFARLNRPCNAQPLECGSVAEASVDGPLRFNVYSAPAEAGDVLLLRILRTGTGGGFKPRAEVYGPDGVRLAVASATTEQSRALFKAPAAGVYTVIAYDGADGTRTGAYAVALARVNRPCNATALGCASLLNGAISGPLRFAAYSYNAAANDAFTVRVIDATGTLQEALEVYGPDGNSAGAAVPGNYQTVDVTRAAPGLYTILVMDSGRTAAQGAFALQFVRTRDACGTAPAQGATTSGLITGGVPFAVYTFPATAGDNLLVRSAAFTPALTAAMELFDAEGARVETGTYALAATAKTTGSHTLILGASSPRGTGAYALTWQALNRPAAVQPLGCGQTAAGTLAPGGQFRWYTVNAVSGDVLRLFLTRTSGSFNPQLELFDNAGRRLAGNGGDITRPAPAGGDHLVLVSPATAAGETGAYALAFQRPNNPCGAAPLACGQTVLRTMDAPGRLDAFTFAGNAGDQAVLRVPARFGAFSPYVEFYGPAGNLLQSGALTRLAASLPASGNFTLLVRDRAGINTGTYRVNLQIGQDACAVDDKEAPSVRLLRPTAGEVVAGSLPFRIIWESDDNVDVVSHEVRLSTDGGASFPTRIAAGLSGAAQSYDWQVPADIKPSRDARIEVIAADAAGNTATAASGVLSLIGAGFDGNASATFEYDALDRLVRAAYDDGTVVEYTWDAVGNLLQVSVRKP